MKLPDCIETERLRIRPFVPGDVNAFVAFMTDDAATTEFMFEPEQKTLHGARAFFSNVVASYSTSAPYFFYAVTRAVEGAVIGACGISSLPKEGEFECSVCLAPPERGKGYATEAVRALIDYCFDHYRIEKFRIHINPRNLASINIAARLGMTRVGSGPHPVHGDMSEIYEDTPCSRDS